MDPGQPPTEARRATFSLGKTTAIRDVQSPLGFAVFFTLILDGFGAMVAIWAPLPEWARIAFILLILGLTAAVGWHVRWLVVHVPRHLVFTELSHLRMGLEELRYGSGAKPLPPEAIEAIPPVSPPGPPVPQLPVPSENPDAE